MHRLIECDKGTDDVLGLIFMPGSGCGIKFCFSVGSGLPYPSRNATRKRATNNPK